MNLLTENTVNRVSLFKELIERALQRKADEGFQMPFQASHMSFGGGGLRRNGLGSNLVVASEFDGKRISKSASDTREHQPFFLKGILGAALLWLGLGHP